jgi:septal ring-binding cell division protein DamX
MYKIIVVCAVSLSVGLSAGWALHSTAPSSVPSVGAQPVTPAAGAPVAPLASASVDMSTMRAMLREELAGAAADKRSEAEPASAQPANPASVQTLARRDEAAQAIDGMLAKSVWDANQRRSFEQTLMLLDPNQREHALQQLATGINSGAIRIHFGARPPT